MSKTIIGKNIFFPTPICIITTKLNDKINFMTAGWFSRVNTNPPQLAVSINRIHNTSKIIEQTQYFSINFPGKNLINETDFAGVTSGYNIDKSELFDVFYGQMQGAPMVKDCPLNISCKLAQTVQLSTNTIYIADIIEVYVDEEYHDGHHVDFKAFENIFLTAPDNQYWTLGENIGKAWNIGKDLQDSQ